MGQIDYYVKVWFVPHSTGVIYLLDLIYQNNAYLSQPMQFSYSSR